MPMPMPFSFGIGIGAIIRKRREIMCLLYAEFLVSDFQNPKYLQINFNHCNVLQFIMILPVILFTKISNKN